jgi:hypothetical protein
LDLKEKAGLPLFPRAGFKTNRVLEPARLSVLDLSRFPGTGVSESRWYEQTLDKNGERKDHVADVWRVVFISIPVFYRACSPGCPEGGKRGSANDP